MVVLAHGTSTGELLPPDQRNPAALRKKATATGRALARNAPSPRATRRHGSSMEESA